MSKDTFHHPTVPHYCPTDTPRPRRKGIRPLPEFMVGHKAAVAQARRFVWKWIRENWAIGERFHIVEPDVDEDPLKSAFSKNYGGRTGVFAGLNLVGSITMVQFRFDDFRDGDRYDSRDTTKSPFSCSPFNWYHSAEKPV